MFGFLASPCRTCAPDDTHSTYRSFFCGLSGALRDDYTPAARFLVNRDSTFLSLLTASINPAAPSVSNRTCCNPISIPRPLFSNDLHARFAAAVTVCGLSAKLDDDRSDETGLRKNTARLLGRAVRPMTDRAISFLNSIRFPTAEVIEMMDEQSAIEDAQPDLLSAASPTSQAYGTIFGHAALLADAPDQKNKLQSLGQNLGRLIYWQDAHQDRSEDAKRGRFNPLEKADPEEFQHHFTSALTNFHQVVNLTGSFQETVHQVLSSTLAKHQTLVPAGAFSQLENPPAKKPRKRKKRKDQWWHNCCNCSDCCLPCPSPKKGGCCDSAFDCGPGDTGCIDCDCCSCSCT